MSISDYIIPPALINNGAGEQTLNSIAAVGSTIPLVYGQARVAARYLDAVSHADKVLLVMLWSLGECVGVQSLSTSSGEPLSELISLRHYNGAQTAPDAGLVSAFAAMNKPFNAALTNRCYTVMEIPAIADVDPDTWVATVKGQRVYDPRDAAQSLTLPATWQWSDNPALCLADFLSNERYGWGHDLDWGSVIDAANYCDEPVTDGANTYRRWTMNLAITDRQPTRQLIDYLRTYANCFVVEDGGVLKLVPDRPLNAPVYEFNYSERGIVGVPSLTRAGVQQLPTVMRVSYTDKRQATWATRDAFAYMPGVQEGATRWSESSVTLIGVDTYQEAMRVATERLMKLYLGNLSVAATIRDIGLLLEAGDVVRIPHPAFPSGKLFRLTANPQPGTLPGTSSITGVEYDPAMYSNDVHTAPEYGDTTLPDPTHPPAPTNLQVWEQVLYQGGAWISKLLSTWDIATWPWQLEYEVEITPSGSADPADDVPVSNTTSVRSHSYSADAGVTYTIQVRSRFRTYKSPWVTATITAHGSQKLPSDVFDWVRHYEMAGDVFLTWTPVADNDLDYYEIRRVPNAPSIVFATMTQAQADALWAAGTLVDQLTSVDKVCQVQPEGFWIYMVKAHNVVGNYSARPLCCREQVKLQYFGFAGMRNALGFGELGLPEVGGQFKEYMNNE